MLDVDRKRETMEPANLINFIILQTQSITSILVCLNFVQSYKVAILLNTIFSALSILGNLRMTFKDEASMGEILSDNLPAFVQMLINSVLGLAII